MADSDIFIVSFVFFILIAAAISVILITLRTQSNIALAKMANLPVSANDPSVVSSGKLAPVPEGLSPELKIGGLTAIVMMSLSAPSILRVISKATLAGSLKAAPKLTAAVTKGSVAIANKIIPSTVTKVVAAISQRVAASTGLKIASAVAKTSNRILLATLPFVVVDIMDPNHLILPGDSENEKTSAIIRQAVKSAVLGSGTAWPIIIGPLTPFMNDATLFGDMVAEQLAADVAKATEHGEMHPMIHDIIVNAIAEGKTVADLSDDTFWINAQKRLNMSTYIDATLANLCVAKGGKSVKLSDGSFACSYTSSDACKSSYGYSLPVNTAEGKVYAEYYDNNDGAGPVCQFSSDVMRSMCTSFGLDALYDEGKGYCKMDQNTCAVKRMTWNASTQMCDLDKTQTVFETIFSTYLTRSILSIFTPNGTCPPWTETYNGTCLNHECITTEATLNAKELVRSPYSLISNDMELVLKTDGDLLIIDHTNGITKTIWSTGPGKGSAPFSLALSPNGILKVADATAVTQWQSSAPLSNHAAPYAMKFSDNGNLKVIDAARQTVWTSNSNQFVFVDYRVTNPVFNRTSLWSNQSTDKPLNDINPSHIGPKNKIKCVHKADYPGHDIWYTENGAKATDGGVCPSGFEWRDGGCYGNKGYQILTKPSCYNPFNWGKDNCFGADGGWYNDPPCPAGFKYQTLGCQPDNTCPSGFDPIEAQVTGTGNYQVCTAKVLGPGKMRDAVTKTGIW